MVQKLIVEVVDARNLMPKDGHGTSSPYVQVDYYGQRKRTKTAICELNPTWNEVLEFNVAKPSEAQVLGDMLEVIIYHDKNHGPTTRNNFLGWIRLNSTQLFVKKGEEALIYFPLQKKSLFSWIQGDIGLKIYYVDHDENEVVPPPPPPEPEKKQEEPPAINQCIIGSEAGHLVEGILQAKASFSCFFFNHLKMDCNRVAHELAQFANINHCTQV